jgi:ubiquinone/menaquinone biosynthesis C-methylase UbiE
MPGTSKKSSKRPKSKPGKEKKMSVAAKPVAKAKDAKTAVKGYFAKVAPEWDAMRHGYFEEGLSDDIIEEADITVGSTVLDIGCGTGFLTLPATKAVGQTGKVIAIDFSEQMLEHAKENLEKAGLLEHAQFRVGDAERIPLDDASVDTVVGNMVLHHCPEPEAAIREMVRVLKPNGSLVLADLEPHNEEWMKDEMADVWLGFDPLDVERWLERAGLEEVTVETLRTKCCGESVAGRKVNIPVFLAKGTK